MDARQFLSVYRAMVMAREIDRLEQQLTSRGEAFFHVAGAGHEASAGLVLHLIGSDWLHCHYRDKALMLARGLTPKAFFDALYCKDASHSRGRQMSAHMSDRHLRILSIVGPVGNSALQSVGVAATVKDQPTRPLVVCSVGDGTTQEGEYIEALAEAAREHVPVLFLVEDNHWAISTPTRGRTFYSISGRKLDEFHGIPLRRVDGRDTIATTNLLGDVVATIREERGPQIVILDVERLTNHTNADDQSLYRSQEDLRHARQTGDPIPRLEANLIRLGVPQEELDQIRGEVVQEVAEAERQAAEGEDPRPMFTAKRPLPVELTHPSQERRGDRSAEGSLTMRDALRDVLRHHLEHDGTVTLFGEDIEDPKGDVFGVTRGLSRDFPGRVCNSPLSESTIVGVSVGRALAGGRPVAFLQFADFLPLAYNQIISELGSMFWRTDGHWQAPVIVMVPCGGYRPGLGPFHGQTLESLIVHTPGVDVFMPSTAADAAGLLNAVFRSQRPTVFFYSKSLLNDPAVATSSDVTDHFVPIGPCRRVRGGRDLTLVGWGNAVRLCQRAADELEKAGIEAEILDLRTLCPWDSQAVIESAEKTAHLIVVHEDNHTCGLGGEILATVAEKARVPVAMRRVTRPDTFIPCNFENQIEVLPSLKRVLASAAELLDLDLKWIPPESSDSGIVAIEAIGSGPSDETVIVTELTAAVGDTIQRGDAVASLEASKSVFELTSPVSGTIVEVVATEGETVPVGAPLFRVRCSETSRRKKPVAKENPGTPILERRPTAERLRVPRQTTTPRHFDVGMSLIATACGSRLISNDDLLRAGHTDGSVIRSGEDIVRRTGIETRHWIAPGEDAIELSVRACRQVLEQQQLHPNDVDVVICSTTSPNAVAPSMACQILDRLSRDCEGSYSQAYDIHAACSGYLYALQAGFDYLQNDPNGRVLVVTTEVLSPLLNPDDFDTVVLFSDAASATILYGENHLDHAAVRLFRPELSAKGDMDAALSVPLLNSGFIQMKGRRVFTEAVRTMVFSLNRVCQREGLRVRDLDLIVPHQANQRILDAIQCRVEPKVFSNIRYHGNTSSTSIPLCLAELLPEIRTRQRLGLCAFGGGFTFGAGILQAIA